MIIDLVVGAVILVSAVISFFRGFIRETLTIAGVAGGGFAAILFGPSLAPTFRNWLGIVDGEPVEKLFDLVPMTIIANVCAYAAIFIGVVITISVIRLLFAILASILKTESLRIRVALRNYSFLGKLHIFVALQIKYRLWPRVLGSQRKNPFVNISYE